jgi:WD40 repeat protein
MTMVGTGLGWSRRAVLLALAAAATGCEARDAVAPQMVAEGKPSAQLGPFGAWSPAVRIEAASPGADPSFNTPFLDGCPVSSRDGKMFFLASNRPGGLGGIDIWVSRRERVDDPWGAPVNVGAPINSASNDFCPMPARDGHEFFFVSNRPGGCGGDDIYVTRFRDDGTIDPPENLGCDVNSAGNEAGPVPITEPGRGPVLYFSSTRAGGFSPEPAGATSGDADLYSSEWEGGRYQPPTLVLGVNSDKDDMQPYIQRDALEVYFSSNRGGNPDIWMARRAKAHDAWSAPVNLGGSVNGPAGESRPSLSWDGTTLYFGSTRSTGESNIYVSFRDRLAGKQP